MIEPGLDRRSLTPCLDENGMEDENCELESSKEIELSDISDIEDENWQISDDRGATSKSNGNGTNSKDLTFKKINRSTRGRNYRDNIRRNPEINSHSQQRTSHQPYRSFDTKRREIKRYNVRNVVASRDFSISRSRSRSPRVDSIGSRHRSRSLSPKRDVYKRKSISPARRRSNRYNVPPRKYSPPSSKHSRSPSLALGRYRNNYQRTPEETVRRSRSRHKSDKTRSTEKVSKRKKHKSKDHQRKHKKSRSKSKPRHSSSPSISPEPAPSVTSQSRQIMNVANSSLPQENIKIILKNEEAIAKRQKLKKREKKVKKDKILRKEVAEKSQPTKEPPAGKEVSKEVFASGDNILISVCFNNNNNNNNGKPKEDQEIVGRQLTPIKTKSKRRQPSPASSISSTSFEETERRQRKHKRKKVKNKRDRVESKAPETPPIIMQSKRKSDMKPIAIIDLEKSPGKEVTQSPREVIVLSDSDGDGKKRDASSKDVIIIDDIVLDKNASRIQAPASPPVLIPSQPVLKFALKSKSNILPINLLHDHAEEIEDQENSNANNANDSIKNSNNHQLDEGNILENKNSSQRDVYDPFEPTKSGSVSPVTPPPPNDVSSSSDMTKNKTDSPAEKIQTPAKELPKVPAIGSEEHLISSSSLSIWSRKEFEKKLTTQPTTPPLPPTFNAFTGTSSQTTKQHASLYDGIYGNDLKTPVLPSPAKQITKSSHDDKKTNDDDRTPYSPSSDGYDFEPPPAATDKDPGSGSSYTFSSTDDGQPKPLKLTESTLKTFNSTMRSTGPVGLKYVNKTELSIFENYLPTSQQKSPLVKRQSGSSFLRSKMSRFTNSMNENGSPAMARNYHDTLKPPVIEDSILDDDVPNSAVDLINKDRFLKKSLRIERVAEEVKLVLKPHYNKKNVTKEEYKEILRKAVPKICHNKTGEINIQKIHALVEAYIKKVRYKRKSGNAAISL